MGNPAFGIWPADSSDIFGVNQRKKSPEFVPKSDSLGIINEGECNACRGSVLCKDRVVYSCKDLLMEYDRIEGEKGDK